jgi:hypothetical protein
MEQKEDLQRQRQLLLEMQTRLELKEAQLEAEAEELAAQEAAISARMSHVSRLLIRPALNLVEGLLERGAREVRVKVGAEGATLMQNVIRIARNAIGLPEISIDSSAGDIGEAQLKAMVRQLTDAEQQLRTDVANAELRSLMGDDSVVEPGGSRGVSPRPTPAG